MVNAKNYSRVGKLLAVIAVMLVIAPPLQLFAFLGLGKFSVWISLGIPAVFFGIGYLLQTVVSKISGCEPNDGESGIEGVKLNYVDKKVIAFPVFLCALEGVGIYFLITFLLKRFDIIYDPYSLYLYLIPAVLALFSVAGCVFWFIPYNKILPMEMLPLFFAVFAFTFIFSIFFKADQSFLSICLLIFFPIFMIVNNLYNIEESIKHAKFRMPENNFRSYNFALTVKYILVTFTVIALMFSLYYAIASNTSVRFSQMKNERSEWEQRDISSGTASEKNDNGSVSEITDNSKLLEENTGGTTVSQLLSYIIVIGGFLIVLGYWLYKKHLFKKLFSVLGLLWQGFFEFVQSLFELIGLIGVKEKYELPRTYVDTEEYLDPYADYYSRYGEYKGLEYLSIKEFDAELEAKESPEEKYAYAYSTYCGLIRMGDNGIKRSDTPRVLTQKLKAQRKADLERATPLYEDIRYRLKKPESAPAERELKELVSLVHSLLRSV
ncbi:MAG: hypothetical protein E7591_05345 [Ruminococcaceae bacterium]|nr:hypothetical protein [Oscillospiraceae bacterium]